ncbi:DUF441 domain-containing protein [Tumebacillus lipolyticus]|uniref:UPF0756 membrane protein ACFSOY_01950 n=1 Tax=Tumebacillus lipolyticus TaxID=1280370 RepID=A0ABW4ZTM0_9BACL
MDLTNLLLLILLAIGIIGNNHTVSIAVAVLLLIRLVHLEKVLPSLEQHGLNVGVIILTIGVLAPLASGKISINEVMHTFTSPAALLAIAMGMFVSYAAGRGIPLMSGNPLVVTGLMIGTILGVALFKGVPTGPVIAGGLTALLLGLFQR